MRYVERIRIILFFPGHRLSVDSLTPGAGTAEAKPPLLGLAFSIALIHSWWEAGPLPMPSLRRDEYLRLQRVAAFADTPAADGTARACSGSAFVSTETAWAAWDRSLLPACPVSVRSVAEGALPGRTCPVRTPSGVPERHLGRGGSERAALRGLAPLRVSSGVTCAAALRDRR